MAPPTSLLSWSALSTYYETVGKNASLKALFAGNSERFSKMSLAFSYSASGPITKKDRRVKDAKNDSENVLLVDFSKNLVDCEALGLLRKVAEEAKVMTAAREMFAGAEINMTEKRAVLHVALRNSSNSPILVGGADVMPAINSVLAHMKAFTECVRSGAFKGRFEMF